MAVSLSAKADREHAVCVGRLYDGYLPHRCWWRTMSAYHFRLQPDPTHAYVRPQALDFLDQVIFLGLQTFSTRRCLQ
jgi:hypothetical protein